MISKVSAEGKTVFLLGATKKLEFPNAAVGNPATFIGTYLGGEIDASSGTGQVDIYSLKMIKKGLTGLPSENEVQKVNNSANATNSMIGVPLPSLPVVMRGY